jgi:hypothetical protein
MSPAAAQPMEARTGDSPQRQAALDDEELLRRGRAYDHAPRGDFDHTAAEPPILARLAMHLTQEGAAMAPGEPVVQQDIFLGGQTINPAYQLPHKTANIYKEQVAATMQITPRRLVHETRKWQADRPLVVEPFARALRKIPEQMRSHHGAPACGPLSHPNEPVWSEMSHRLHVILKRQGRRAERRRKRRIQSKLFPGASRGRKGGEKRVSHSAGTMLQDYLAERKTEHANGVQARPGDPDGEFLEKVHEKYQLRKELIESKPFRQYLGTGGNVVTVYGVPRTPPSKKPVVRPVYCPPPPGRY